MTSEKTISGWTLAGVIVKEQAEAMRRRGYDA
jgi:hypothetical protein